MDSKIQGRPLHFFGFGEGFRLLWGYFGGFLGQISVILQYFTLFFNILPIVSAILRYFTLISDPMIVYLRVIFGGLIRPAMALEGCSSRHEAL